MPSERTFVTELATAVGMTGSPALAAAMTPAAPRALAAGSGEVWGRLLELYASGRFAGEFRAGFENGRAFLLAEDALRGREPVLIEWTGGRRPPGDEAIPADLRIDHVYIVSCKYLSRILHNPSPARLVDSLLQQGQVRDTRDWFGRVAPSEYQVLYEACASGVGGLPLFAATLSVDDRRRLAAALEGGWPDGAEEAYQSLCASVARATAAAWSRRVAESSAEAVLWRLLRISAVPYFVLGSGREGPLRLRIDTPWDWRRRYRLAGFEVEAQEGGQARVAWRARYEERRSGADGTVEGHVEIRWSHGRFASPPEAKVYLDTPHGRVPGYHRLEADEAVATTRVEQLAL